MRFSYLKVALGVGVLSLVGWSIPGCGSSNSGGSGGTSGSGGNAGTAGNAGNAGTAGTGGGGGSGGTTDGGTGGSPDAGDAGATITCGSNTCSGTSVVIATANPCCAGTNKDQCGLDTSPLQQFGLTFTPACQAKNQPGNLDTSCPDFNKTVSGIAIKLPGCCHAATSTCGYMADEVAGVVNLHMGCVDSSPFLEGGTPKSCTPTTDAGSGG